MANFNDFIPKLLRLEGGFQKHKKDRGNYNSLGHLVGTNYGIAAPTYEGYLKRPPTETDMRSITQSEASDIYKKNYWNASKASEINDQQVAEIIVDHAVNAGPKRAGLLVQTILNNRFNKTLVRDGAIGPKTIASINSVDPKTLFNHLKEARQQYYTSLGNATFLSGWLTRLNHFAYVETVTTYNRMSSKKK